MTSEFPPHYPSSLPQLTLASSNHPVVTWAVSKFPCYLLTWTSSFARDDDAQQERRNGFSAIATVMSLFHSLCVSFCLAAVRGARASRGKRQAGLLFVFGFPS